MGLTQSYIGIPMMRSKVVTTTAHDYTISVHFTRLQMIEASELRVYTLNLFFLFSFSFYFLFLSFLRTRVALLSGYSKLITNRSYIGINLFKKFTLNSHHPIHPFSLSPC